MTRRFVWYVGAMAVFLTACASTGEQRSGTHPRLISEQEVEASLTANAYELIQNLRPRWLHDRGPISFGLGSESGIVVYVDGVRLGFVDMLREVSTRDVVSAERLSSGEATQRFGGGHPHGAILVSTR